MSSWLFRISLLILAVNLGGCSGEEQGTQAEEIASDDDASAATAAETTEAVAVVEPHAEAKPSGASPSSKSDAAKAPAVEKAPVVETVPAEKAVVEIEVPSGTLLELELLTGLDTSASRVGDAIQARTLSPIYVEGALVLGEGAYVEGRVTEVEASGRVKGRAKLGFTFDRLKTASGLEKIRTSFVAEEAESGQKKDAAVIGGATGIGAVVGGIIGGKKGAAIGAAVGGAGGAGVVLSTRGEEIRLPAGTPVNVRLDEPVTVRVN